MSSSRESLQTLLNCASSFLMISDDIRALVKADRFHPFEIILKSGEVFLVRTNDHAWVRPSGVVHLVDQDERLRIFSPARIHQIKAAAAAAEHSG